jgi:hypothetical protein
LRHEAILDTVDLVLSHVFWPLRVAALGGQIFFWQHNHPFFTLGLCNLESLISGVAVLTNEKEGFVTDQEPPPPEPPGLPIVFDQVLPGVRFHRLSSTFRFIKMFKILVSISPVALIPGLACIAVFGNLVESALSGPAGLYLVVKDLCLIV